MGEGGATGDPGEVAWDIPRPASTCQHLLRAAEAQGIGVDTCLAGTGLTTAEITDTATEVQAAQELTIVRNVLARIGDPGRFARDVGAQYNFANTGILGYAVLASPTIGDAVNVSCRYAALSSTYLRLRRTDTPAGAVVEFDNSAVPADVRGFMLERDLVALANMAPLLVGQLEASTPILVESPGIELPAERLEFDRLTVVIDGSASRTAVTIPADVLALPMPAADAATAATCVRQCAELLQSRRQRRGLAARVRSRLIATPGQLPPMAEIAEEMAMTERTLHRRLAAEGTSYRGLVDEVRVALAVALLESGLTVEETARQLGYSETAAFTRAFIRWTGDRPSAHRKRPG
ncbi:helix-turn-helix domain-containing protein [Mycolicibacillus trivialis]|nr:AraC family transcriptional regulator [Mycolicibacillus trivialis]